MLSLFEPTLEADFYHDPLNVESSKWVESSLRVSYPAGPLRLFTAQSFEISDYRGAYFGEAGIDYERRLSEKAKLEITPNIGWASAKFNEANIAVPKAAFNLVAVESSLTYYVNKICICARNSVSAASWMRNCVRRYCTPRS